MLARFHQALRGTGFTERKYSIDNRFYLFAGQWPDFFFDNLFDISVKRAIVEIAFVFISSKVDDTSSSQFS